MPDGKGAKDVRTYTNSKISKAWLKNRNSPVIINIFLQKNNSDNTNFMLIEKWKFHNSKDSTSRRDIRLNSINRRLCILQRTLYCYVRMLPAYILCSSSRDIKLKFSIDSTDSNNNDNIKFQDSKISSYSFPPISIISGAVSLTAHYLSSDVFKVNYLYHTFL